MALLAKLDNLMRVMKGLDAPMLGVPYHQVSDQAIENGTVTTESLIAEGAKQTLQTLKDSGADISWIKKLTPIYYDIQASQQFDEVLHEQQIFKPTEYQHTFVPIAWLIDSKDGNTYMIYRGTKFWYERQASSGEGNTFLTKDKVKMSELVAKSTASGSMRKAAYVVLTQKHALVGSHLDQIKAHFGDNVPVAIYGMAHSLGGNLMPGAMFYTESLFKTIVPMKGVIFGGLPGYDAGAALSFKERNIQFKSIFNISDKVATWGLTYDFVALGENIPLKNALPLPFPACHPLSAYLSWWEDLKGKSQLDFK